MSKLNKLLEILRQKELWLSKILDVNLRFIQMHKKNPNEALDDLDRFDQNRESLVKMVISTETKIIDLLRQCKGHQPTAAQRNQIQNYITSFEKKHSEMLSLDSEILTILDTLKVEQESKLNGLQKGKKALDKYKGRTSNHSNFDVQL